MFFFVRTTDLPCQKKIKSLLAKNQRPMGQFFVMGINTENCNLLNFRPLNPLASEFRFE